MKHIPSARCCLHVGLFVLLLGSTLLATPTAVSAASVTPPVPLAISPVNPSELASLSAIAGRAHVVQDPTWLQRKFAFQIARPGYGIPRWATNAALPTSATVTASLSTSYLLDTTLTRQVAEPPPVGQDVAGTNYRDSYMAYFCGPGATDVAMTYWSLPPNLVYPKQTYTDPSGSTTWDDKYYRSYLVYIADKVKLPGWTTAGEPTFNNPKQGIANTFPSDLRDTMNWEASGHSATYGSFFYAWVPETDLTENDLYTDITIDIYYDHVPPVMNVDDAYLPSWHGSPSAGGGHSIAIVGFNDTTSMYTYIETCTTASCGTEGTGAYQISYTALYNAMRADTAVDFNPNDNVSELDGGIVW
jgi:hypothetical protein